MSQGGYSTYDVRIRAVQAVVRSWLCDRGRCGGLQYGSHHPVSVDTDDIDNREKMACTGKPEVDARAS